MSCKGEIELNEETKNHPKWLTEHGYEVEVVGTVDDGIIKVTGKGEMLDGNKGKEVVLDLRGDHEAAQAKIDAFAKAGNLLSYIAPVMLEGYDKPLFGGVLAGRIGPASALIAKKVKTKKSPKVVQGFK